MLGYKTRFLLTTRSFPILCIYRLTWTCPWRVDRFEWLIPEIAEHKWDCKWLPISRDSEQCFCLTKSRLTWPYNARDEQEMNTSCYSTTKFQCLPRLHVQLGSGCTLHTHTAHIIIMMPGFSCRRLTGGWLQHTWPLFSELAGHVLKAWIFWSWF